jgi:DIS3-like exonuclease 2
MKCRPIEEVAVVVNPSELSEKDEESGVTEAGGCTIFLVFFLIRC